MKSLSLNLAPLESTFLGTGTITPQWQAPADQDSKAKEAEREVVSENGSVTGKAETEDDAEASAEDDCPELESGCDDKQSGPESKGGTGKKSCADIRNEFAGAERWKLFGHSSLPGEFKKARMRGRTSLRVPSLCLSRSVEQKKSWAGPAAEQSEETAGSGKKSSGAATEADGKGRLSETLNEDPDCVACHKCDPKAKVGTWAGPLRGVTGETGSLRTIVLLSGRQVPCQVWSTAFVPL